MLNSLDVLQAVYKARYFNTEIKKKTCLADIMPYLKNTKWKYLTERYKIRTRVYN